MAIRFRPVAAFRVRPLLCGFGAARQAVPGRAHAVAVGAARRLHCDARPAVASQNSLRSLRSLRSNNCAESVYEARFSSPQKSPPPGTARRADPLVLFPQEAPACPQRRVRADRGAPLGRREAQGSWPRAKRESSTDSSQLFERSERSERSEFCDGAARPSIAGQSARSADRPSQALRAARTRLCRTHRLANSGRSRSATGRKQPTAVSAPRW